MNDCSVNDAIGHVIYHPPPPLPRGMALYMWILTSNNTGVCPGTLISARNEFSNSILLPDLVISPRIWLPLSALTARAWLQWPGPHRRANQSVRFSEVLFSAIQWVIVTLKHIIQTLKAVSSGNKGF